MTVSKVASSLSQAASSDQCLNRENGGRGSGRRIQSLKKKLILRFLALQVGILIVVAILMLARGVILNFWLADRSLGLLRGAVERDAAGDLQLHRTPELETWKSALPGFWFVIRDRQGKRLSEGTVPPEFVRLGNALNDAGQAQFGWDIWRPTTRIGWVDTAAGNVQILTGSVSNEPLRTVGFVTLVLPIFASIAISIVVATPIIVRRAFAGMSRVAAQAENIDISRRGIRLSRENIPAEMVSIIDAVNDALGRLDDGYERHQRFLADAAHELRTPVAILSTRIASLPSGETRNRLSEDVARLAILTEQLLDLQRLERHADDFEPVDLVEMSQEVVLDLAPLGFSAGYDMVFRCDVESSFVFGNRMAMERALTNLVQNAIDHGGRRGTITIRVLAPASVEVSDEGDGIPQNAREQIFEPFFRLWPQGRGTGLGLNLVKAIVQLHGGKVAATDGPSGGACFRMSFPPAKDGVILERSDT